MDRQLPTIAAAANAALTLSCAHARVHAHTHKQTFSYAHTPTGRHIIADRLSVSGSCGGR